MMYILIAVVLWLLWKTGVYVYQQAEGKSGKMWLYSYLLWFVLACVVFGLVAISAIATDESMGGEVIMLPVAAAVTAVPGCLFTVTSAFRQRGKAREKQAAFDAAVAAAERNIQNANQ